MTPVLPPGGYLVAAARSESELDDELSSLPSMPAVDAASMPKPGGSVRDCVPFKRLK